MLKSSYILLFLLLPFSYIKGQAITFSHLGTVQGLSDNKVTCAVTDKDGFLWAGTSNGLNRYDGFGITAYFKQNYPALCSNEIAGLYCDSKNRIWVGSYSGVTLIDQDRQFKQIVFDEQTGTKYSCAVVIESKTMGIIMFTSKGHYRFDEKNNKWEQLEWSTREQFTIGWRDNTRFDEDRYIQTGHSKLILLDYATKKKGFEFALPNLISSCAISKDEIMAATYKGRLYRISISQNKVIKEYPFTITRNGQLLNANVVRLRQAADGRLVITTTLGGLFLFDPTTEKFAQYTHNPADEYSVSEDGKEYVSCDGQGNVLLYGGRGGLDYFNLVNYTAGYISGFSSEGNELYMGGFRCIDKDSKGRLWMGGMDALVMYDPASKKSAVYRYYYPVLNSGEQPVGIQTICVDSKDRVWVGTSGGGMGRLNEATGKFYRMSMDSLDGQAPRLPSNFVFDIAEIGKDSLWAGCTKGFYIINSNTYKVDSLKPAMVFKQGADPAVIKIVADSKGMVWIGCWGNGIFYYDRQTKQLREVSYAAGKPPSVVSSLQEMDGKMYAAAGDGLYVINEKNEAVKYLAEAGKNHTNISSLIAVANKELWFSGNNLIGLFNTANKKFSILDQEVKQNVFGFSEGVAWNDTLQYWCAEKGLVYFNPYKLNTAAQPLRPLVYSVNTSDSVYSFSDDKQIDLSNKYHTISFSFTAPKLYGSKQILFQYRLDGVDKDWISNSGSRLVRYNSLAPGKYTFRCRASLDGIVWSEESNEVIVVIHPSLWQRWWFKTLLALLAAGIIYAVFRRRVAAVREREKIKAAYEKKIAEVEMSSLRAQMNPHFMFNSLNSINNFILKNDPENASGYLTKFSRLMRLILENSRSEWVSLENELKALELYTELEALRFENSFTYSIQARNDVDVETTMVPPMIIQPYVENAIWHGLMHRKEPGSALLIEVWKMDGAVYIKIEDNGIGREEAARRKSKSALSQKSHGMKITAQRLDIVNKLYNAGAKVEITDLKDQDGRPAGTHVLLKLNYKSHDSRDSG